MDEKSESVGGYEKANITMNYKGLIVVDSRDYWRPEESSLMFWYRDC